MGRDSLVGLLLLLLCTWLYWQSREIPSPPFVPLGPAFYPQVVLGLLAFLSLLLTFRGLIKGGRQAGPSALGDLPSRARAWLGRYGRVLLCLGTLGAYAALLPILGYLLSTFLFTGVLQWLLGSRALRTLPFSLAVAAGTAYSTYLVFEVYLRVLLPRGVLF